MKASEVTAEANQRDAVAVLEAIRERLDPEGSTTSTLHPLPPLPQLPQPPTPVLVPPVAMSPKKRHTNGFEDALGKGRPDLRTCKPVYRVQLFRLRSDRSAVHSRPHPCMLPYLALAKWTVSTQSLFRRQRLVSVYFKTRNESISSRVQQPKSPRMATAPTPTSLEHTASTTKWTRIDSPTSSRASSHRPLADASLGPTFLPTPPRLADSSREAQCGWRPDASPGFPRHETFGQVHAHASSAATSMFANESEPEAIKRIQTWRVQITNPPSVLGSQCASAHSGLYTDGGLSSHLTSISRSPLSKDNKPRSQVDDAQKTPVLKSRALPNGRHRLAEESRRNKEGRSHRELRGRDAKTNTDGCHGIGTRHIARLTDSQSSDSLVRPKPCARKVA